MEKIILITLFVVSAVIILDPPQNTIFDFREGEIQFLNQRRSFYPNPFLGRLFENKVTVYFSHYLTNISYGLDPNLYFFASNPRERAGFSEYQRFPFWLLPLFLFGIFRQLTKNQFVPIVYFFVCLFYISFFVPFDKYIYVLYPFFVISSLTWLLG